MRSVLSFDELNKLGIERRSMEFEQYFGEMGLSREQLDRRMDIADRLEDAFLDFYFWFTANEDADSERVRSEVRQRIDNAVRTETDIDDALKAKLDAISDSIADTTIKRIDDPFTLSEDRAKENAEDTANSVWNYKEYEEALDSRARFKMWIAILDEKTRPDHEDADGQVVEITEPFDVGGWPMMYPKDDSMGAPLDEIVNCRCTVEYLNTI